MASDTLIFFRRGQQVRVENVPPTRTLLEVLREDLRCRAAKEGCGEGDCGACTVVVGEPAGAGLRMRAINSCIRLAHSVAGLAVWTAEDIAPNDGRMHPAQQAMMDSHGSQCGFCTPGFVMSLFGMYQNHIAQGRSVTRALAQQELSGNLCRCTGYRPIFDAAQNMHTYPPATIDVRALTMSMQTHLQAPRKNASQCYFLPATLQDLLKLRAAHPAAQLVAGCTDVGLWVTKQHVQYAKVLDVTRVTQLRQIQDYAHHIAIGAAVTLADAYGALVTHRPHLAQFAARFAGLPVRNSGTLGGNIANASPIGDSMPLLIALGANLVLARWSADGVRYREMPLQQFYTGYRKTVLANDEVLAWIKVPKPQAGEFLRAYKISKRYDDDISAVCLAIKLELDKGFVTRACIGAGGVAATPVRAEKTEQILTGKPWTEALARHAGQCLREEFAPISDMRASASYRSAMLQNLMQRYWLESQGMQHINLESTGVVQAR